MTQRLQTYFFNKVRPYWFNSSQSEKATNSSFFHIDFPIDIDYYNIYQVPILKKIVLNRGLGNVSQNPKILESSLNEFQKITGQKAQIHYSKKSIAGFDIRKKMPIGVAVTLRKNFMYDFLDRLINLALPRIRDFNGLSLKSFDGYGNYNFGLNEQLMFPEIRYDQIQQIRGMDIAIITTAKSDEEGLALLQSFGIPFQKFSIE